MCRTIAANSNFRRRLLARIGRRYEPVTRELRIGPLVIPFTQVRDPDRVLDQVVAEADRREKIAGAKQPDDELHLPYWAEVWDSALGVGEWLCENHNTTDFPAHRLNILDLGCGMGLAGAVAAALGHRVLLADIETPALLFARLNSSAHRDRVRARRMDWKRDRLDETFDLILGADVLYDKSQWEHLEPFWRAHLSPGGTVVLGEPGRQTGDLFVQWIAARDWRLHESFQPVSTREKPIRLFALQRSCRPSLIRSP